jgi:hypothetical protein
MAPTAEDLDGYDDATVYEDGTVVRVSIRRTDDEAYPSGWRYTLHYGALTAGPETLEDGTIRRYLENRRFSTIVETALPFRDDNAHEATKGHERHVAPDPEPKRIEFPGIEELYERFWDEIPKPRFGPSETGES